MFEYLPSSNMTTSSTTMSSGNKTMVKIPRAKSMITIRISGQTVDEEKNEIVKFPLHFKEDGKRFVMEQTLKMLVSCSYRFDMLLERTYCHVRHIKLDIGIEPNVQTTFIESVQQHFCDPDRSRISFIWDSRNGKPKPDRKNQRDILRITLIFFDMTIIDIPIQVRFYQKLGKHYRWGEELDYCRASFLNNGLHQTIITKSYAKPKYFHSIYQNGH